MFDVRPPLSLPEEVAEAGKADGFIRICPQAVLSFGSDRRIPTDSRPVVVVRRDGTRNVVLPCTSKDNSSSPDFFELNDNNVMWISAPEGRKSFANYRYEVVDETVLRRKIGAMQQSARIDLLIWLKTRY